MAITSKKMAFKLLANAKGDIYTPGAGVTGHLHTALFCNTHNDALKITLYMHDGAVELELFDELSLAAGETATFPFPGEGLVVDAASKITGFAETADKVTCFLSGSEET
jgi:hypothetical protein